ncbi:hypothetical protein [Xanthomonas euvesicatoria]|uniref:hypothetical protein n=1 Tax=Xanthomonas euvesicatoria TaxID=456327 RepID=UPI0002266630|nr:hypothetical protein [Xanthomonas euvesicatoria]AEO43422.1 hypothetical protein XACM_3173 [Xanthomonas euvesicatoria pv. citrumelo F1]MBV6779024.1 hypothetical protein [Xanthomonas campestris pv. carissae]PPU90241.1 hypothetical protein XaclCFBP3371_00665 [Xanthomonas euvesicatoria pv. citrumelonis]TKA20267.1 hypothetical protein TN51_02790 [Xanthomonas euvesicatoria pv. citrumelonis]
MKAFRVRGIVWETDGKHPVLPTETTVECESEENIADTLSSAYGWLVSDFVVIKGFEAARTSG